MKAELRTLLVSRTGEDVFICLQFYLFSMNRKVMKVESQQLVSRTGEDAGRTFLSFDFHCRRQSLGEEKMKEQDEVNNSEQNQE